MNIAFHAQDTSADDVAALISQILNLGQEDPLGPWLAGFDGAKPPTGQLEDALDAAAHGKRHLMVSLPLAWLGEPSIRRRIDLAVVTFGPSPRAAAAAMLAMEAEGARIDPEARPPWLLPCCAPVDTAGFRTIPVWMSSLRRDEMIRLRAGQPSASLARRAVALAAALQLAADDPFAAVLDRERIRSILTDRGSASDLDLRESLLDLADRLDDMDGDRAVAAVPKCSGRAVQLRRPHRTARSGGRRTIAARLASHRHSAACAGSIHA